MYAEDGISIGLTFTHQQFLSSVVVRTQLSTQLSVWDLEIFAEVAVVGHEAQISVIGYICQLLKKT